MTEPKRREPKKSRRVVSFAKENHLISNHHNDQTPYDSLEIVRKSSNEDDDDCESVSLSMFFFINKLNNYLLENYSIKKTVMMKTVRIQNLRMK